MNFSPGESVREIRFYFEKGLKYLAIATDKQEVEWGLKNEQMEPYLLNLRVEQREDANRFLGPLGFGFSLNGNKFGTLHFVVF